MFLQRPIGPLQILDFSFSPALTLRLPPYAGSAWRGAFGHALKRLVCAMRLRPCAGCPLAGVCMFPLVFGSGTGAEGARPYVLAPEPTRRRAAIAPSATFSVRLVVLPPAATAAPYLVRALVEAARAGIGPDRVPLEPIAITDHAGAAFSPDLLSVPPPVTLAVPPAPERVRLLFATPLRLRLGGDLATGATLRLADLAAAIVRRLALLGFALPPEEARAARAEAAGRDFASARLGWLETTRRSSRQGTLMQLGGIVGEATVLLEGTTLLWPLLWAASVVHVGKGASMGFGRIELANA
jgi:hypothetical protein